MARKRSAPVCAYGDCMTEIDAHTRKVTVTSTLNRTGDRETRVQFCGWPHAGLWLMRQAARTLGTVDGRLDDESRKAASRYLRALVEDE
jgi:hypothetical protein